MIWTKGSDQRANFETLTGRMKINQIPYVIFQVTSQFSFKFATPFSVITHNSTESF